MRTVQCDMSCDKNVGMKTGHEKKKRTSEGNIVLAGTDASPGHLVMRKAWIPKSEWPQNVQKRMPCASGRTTVMRASGRS